MLARQLADASDRIGAHFALVLSDFQPVPVLEAMTYATEGGKRLRGFLALETARLHGVPPSRSIWAATSVEALHAYSLIHDDLPCMDDDDLRRGRPTVHVKWDEATAVLAGDALQALAFELVTHPDTGPPSVQAELARSLAVASGARGMVLGQALDIAAETSAAPLDIQQITELQSGKTGALFEWASCAGARLAQADTLPLRQYARALGLAFQIADDILDVEGDASKAGKRLHKDAAAGKATFVTLLGLDGAKTRAQNLADEACAALSVYGNDADTLREVARFAICRES